MPNVGIRFHTYEFGDKITGWQRRQAFVLNAAEIPRRDGQVIRGGKLGIKEYEVRGTLVGDTPDEVRTQFDAMMAVLANRTANLYLLDDRYTEARLVGYTDSYPDGSALGVLDFILTFQSSLPYELSETLQSQSYTTISVNAETFNVTNNGNYDAFVKITVTAPGSAITADCQINNLTTSDSFSYLGTISATKKLIVNSFSVPFTVYNDGTSDIANYSGAIIKLSPGVNAIQIESVLGANILMEWRDTYV